jgi:hypothetical protein
MRRAVAALGAVAAVLGAAAVAGHAALPVPIAAPAPAPPAVAADDRAVDPVIPAELAGRWLPYDTPANQTLGALTIGAATLRFERGTVLELAVTDGAWRIVRESRTGRKARDPHLCGNRLRAASVGFVPTDAPHPRSLELTVYDVPGGPDGPDFDPHRCQRFTYVRP